MGQVALETQDQHTKVFNESGERIQYNATPSALELKEAFERQSQIDNLNTYYDSFF